MVEQLNCLFQDTLGQQVDHGYLAEALRLVHAGAVDQKWMEKDGVTLLHLQVHPGVLRVIVTHSVVHLVHTTLRTHKQRVCVCVSYQVYFLEEFSLCVCVGVYLPLRVVVLLQGAGVCSRQDDQASILPVHLLHCRPSTDDLVCGAEREVMQILMHRVTRRLLT